jgi:hypothetical protein
MPTQSGQALTTDTLVSDTSRWSGAARMWSCSGALTGSLPEMEPNTFRPVLARLFEMQRCPYIQVIITLLSRRSCCCSCHSTAAPATAELNRLVVGVRAHCHLWLVLSTELGEYKFYDRPHIQVRTSQGYTYRTQRVERLNRSNSPSPAVRICFARVNGRSRILSPTSPSMIVGWLSVLR